MILVIVGGKKETVLRKFLFLSSLPWLIGYNRFSDVLLDNYFALIEKIYAVGGRNFLFVNVPPIQRSPTVRLLSSRGARF